MDASAQEAASTFVFCAGTHGLKDTTPGSTHSSLFWERPSRTLPEMMVYQASGHLSVQSSPHVMKLTITPTKAQVPRPAGPTPPHLSGRGDSVSISLPLPPSFHLPGACLQACLHSRTAPRSLLRDSSLLRGRVHLVAEFCFLSTVFCLFFSYFFFFHIQPCFKAEVFIGKIQAATFSPSRAIWPFWA